MWKCGISLIAIGAMTQACQGQAINAKICQDDGAGGCLIASPSSPMTVTGITSIPTYSSAVVALSNTTAGDVFCISGSSAGKVVKIKGIRVSVDAGTAIVGDAEIVLRSTLDTGGGAASVAVVKNDPGNLSIPASTVTVTSFTSAPVAGNSYGAIRSRKLAASTAGNNAVTSEGLFQFSVYYDQPIILRSPTNAACVNVSAFGTGANWDIDEEHTEE